MGKNAENGALKNKKLYLVLSKVFKTFSKGLFLKRFLKSLSIIDEFDRCYYYFFIDIILNVFLKVH